MPPLSVTTIVNYRQAALLPVPEILRKVGFPLSIGCIALNGSSLTLMTIDRHDCHGVVRRPLPGFKP